MTWRLQGAQALTPTSAELAWLRDYNPRLRPLGLRMTPRARMAPAAILSTLSLTTCARWPLGDDAPLLFLRRVPPGVYRLDVAAASRLSGTLSLLVGQSPRVVDRVPLAVPEALDGYLLRLPAGATALTVVGDEDARRSVASLALRPVTVIGARGRGAPTASGASRSGDVTLFCFDETVFLDGPGASIEGATRARLVLVAGHPSRPVRLLARAPVANTLTLSSGRWTCVLRLRPGRDEVIEVPLNPATGDIALEATTERGFRFADLDGRSTDRRYLGAWLQPVGPE